jgi:hypothetical protein
VSNPGGNIDLVAGSNMTITPNDAANTKTFASSSGTVTGMAAVDTVSTLRTINTDNAIDFPTGTARIVHYYSSPQGLTGPLFYRYDRTSAAAHDGGTVIRPTVGAASTGNGRWLLETRQLYITDFGAEHLGAIANTAITAALAFANASSVVKRVVIPDGTFYIMPYGFMPSTAIRVYDSVTLEGRGYNSVLRYHPQAYQDADANGSSYVAIFYESNTVLRNFRLDGNGPNLATTGTVTLTDVTTNAVKPVEGTPATNCVADNLWLHDLRTIGAREGFALNSNENCTDFFWHNLKVWNITRGTGIHFAAADLANRTERGHIVDCWAWNCGWQGIGTHATRDVSIRGCKTWSNVGAGINLEFTERAEISDCESWNNGKMGLRTIGHIKGLRVNNCNFRKNNPTSQNVTPNSGNDSLANTTAEIAFISGDFLAAGTQFGTIEDAEIVDCKVEPFGVRPHLYIQNYNSANMNPQTHPTKIVLDGHDVHEWFITSGEWGYTDPAQSVPVHITGHYFKRTPKIASVYLKNPNQYGVSRATLSAPVSEGTTNPGATVVNSTATSQLAFTPNNLMPGRTYKIRYRVKQKQAENWNIRIRRTSGITEERRVKLAQQTLDKYKWQEGEFIHTVSDTNPLRVEFDHAGSSTNTQLVVDYCWAEEIPSRSTSAMLMIGSRRVVFGTAAPTTGPPDGGTWRLGDECRNENPTVLGTVGSQYIIDHWKVTTAGNPGTWTEQRMLTGT